VSLQITVEYAFFRVKTGKTTVNYFVFALLTDAECSKKDFIKFATDYVSMSEDDAGKLWLSVRYWAKPHDVYTIADEETYFEQCTVRKCDTLVRSFSPCSYHVQERR